MAEYELLRASNRVKLLEEELRLASGGSVLNAAISSLFQLSEAVVLPDRRLSVSLVANGQAGEPEAFCTAGAVHVFHIGLYALSSVSPIGAGLVASCPQTAGLAKHETVEGLHVPETPTSMRVCAMIELFNTRSLELNSSRTAGITWNLMGSLKQAFAGSEKWLATQELTRHGRDAQDPDA
ncbi:MAG: hypothetical protein SGPRY_002626 [Prymnesium sp.]